MKQNKPPSLIKQLKPASQLAQQFGVKAVLYGAPGTGKTPLLQTLPNPVICVTEPGMLSMRNVQNVACWEASNIDLLDQFFDWLFRSPEAKQFQTVAIDSVSQMAEMVLNAYLPKHKHAMQAYGEMSKKVLEYINGLYYLKGLNVCLIAKEDFSNNERRPYFPGKDLNVKIPHLYDEILHIGEENVTGSVQPQIKIRTKQVFGVIARDRSGRLQELEEPHLGNIFAKCMS